MIDRRRFTLGAAALGGALLAPHTAWSRETLQIGAIELTSVSDGSLTLPAQFLFGPMDQAALAEALKPFEVSPEGELTPPCNLTLLRDGDRVALFDAGAGPGFQASAGRVLEALDAVGVAPEDVTHLVFTHGHPDHLWGVLDDFDEPLFAEAEHMMGRVEFDYWMDPNTVDRIGDARASFAAGAKRRLDLLADRITLFDDGAEVLPGVSARLTAGHTPGHMAFDVRSGSQSVMIVGDAIGNPHIAFARPDWPSGSDQDPALGARTRVALLESLSASQARFIGFHLPAGGIGRVERKDGAFRFAPAEG